MKDKVDPYLRPLYDALQDMLPDGKLGAKLESGQIEIAPLAFMRGRTLANAFVILDEAQNTTPAQMKMFLTRLGENSRMVVTGDPSQDDLPPGTRSGLIDAVNRLDRTSEVAVIRFSEQDIVRHPLVEVILQAYSSEAAPQGQADAGSWLIQTPGPGDISRGGEAAGRAMRTHLAHGPGPTKYHRADRRRPAWRRLLADPKSVCRRAVAATLAGVPSPPWLARSEVSVLLADDATVRKLNADLPRQGSRDRRPVVSHIRQRARRNTRALGARAAPARRHRAGARDRPGRGGGRGYAVLRSRQPPGGPRLPAPHGL